MKVKVVIKMSNEKKFPKKEYQLGCGDLKKTTFKPL